VLVLLGDSPHVGGSIKGKTNPMGGCLPCMYHNFHTYLYTYFFTSENHSVSVQDVKFIYNMRIMFLCSAQLFVQI
jgi:hypothetical protein